MMERAGQADCVPANCHTCRQCLPVIIAKHAIVCSTVRPPCMLQGSTTRGIAANPNRRPLHIVGQKLECHLYQLELSEWQEPLTLLRS